MLGKLEATLADNLQKQSAISADIDKLQRGSAQAAKEVMGAASSAKRSLTVFAAPYFKDIRQFTHPPNRDTVAKRQNNELDTYLSNPREWSAEEKRKLTVAVRDDALRERMRPVMAMKDDLVRRGKKIGVTDAEKNEIMENLAKLKASLDEIRMTPDEQLFHRRDLDFDWMRISAQTVRA